MPRKSLGVVRPSRILAFAISVVASLSYLGWAQSPRDPLSSKEVDQLREAAQDPDQRLKLWVKFARARMSSLDDVRAAPKMADADRPKHTHELLEDLTSIVTEISDNIDDFDLKTSDDKDHQVRTGLRKGLPDVIAMTSEFQGKLRTLKETVSSDPKLRQEYSDFDFVL